MATYQNIEEYRKKKKKKQIIRNIVLAVIIVGILFALLNVLEVFKGSKIQQMITSAQKPNQTAFPLIIGNNQPLDIHSVGNDFAVLTKSSVLTYSGDGKSLKKSPHGYSNPVMKDNGNRILTYDRGGKKFRVDTRASLVGEISVNSTIISADIADNGEVAVTLNYTANQPVVIVYDTSLKTIYKYFSEAEFSSVALSSNGNNIALTAITSPNGVLSCDLYELDITKDTEAKTTSIPNLLPLAVSYQDNGAVAVVGKDSTVFVSGDRQKRYNYPGQLQYFTFAAKDSLVLVTEDMFNNYSAVSVVSQNEMPKKSITLKDEVKDIYSDGSRILVLCKKSAYNFDMSLLRLNQIPLKTSEEKIIYNGDSAYILGENMVNRYSID